MLNLNNLSACRNDTILFEKLGFTLGAGGVLVLRGGNGTGKTTLLRMLAGLVVPHEGAITFNDVDIQDCLHEYQPLVNYIGHHLAVKPELSVAQNLHFWAAMRGNPELSAAAMKFFELDAMQDQRCATLSAGWQQKVALARLMLCDVPIWLLDEPFASLDARSREALLGLIDIHCAQDGMVVVTSHDDVPLARAMELSVEDFVSSC